MSRWFRLVPLVVVLMAASVPAVRSQMSEKEPPHVIVALYHVAPGKHLDFLKWQAQNEAIDREAGVPATVLYAHTSGDSWDYMSIAPDLSKEQQAKVDEVAKKHGKKTGFAASLEFRTFMASHTDTHAIGPVSAADMVAAAK